MTALEHQLAQALENYLRENDPEGFGCGCHPEAPKSICGPCRARNRQAPLHAAMAAYRAQQQAEHGHITVTEFTAEEVAANTVNGIFTPPIRSR